jgi:thioredoxin reductase (NADPH)
MFHTQVTAIEPTQVRVKNGRSEETIRARQVFALTGYHPDFSFLEKQGIQLDRTTKRPALDPETLESNVPGIYLAGVVVGGLQTSKIFIENGRFHGRQIIAAIAGKGKLKDHEPVAPPGE